MKKGVLKNVFLILLPAMSVFLAASMDSVTVFDTINGELSQYSYFSLVPVESLQICPPLAAILAVVATVMAIVFAATGKTWSVKSVFGTAFASAFFATIPIVAGGEVLVVPNAGVPLMMLIDGVLAYTLLKNPGKQMDKEDAPRLRGR